MTKLEILAVILLTWLVTNVFYFLIDTIFYMSNLEYLASHVELHYENGCIYNEQMFICTNAINGEHIE